VTAPVATSPDEPAGVPSGWEPVRAPYRGLRGPLTRAEGLLNTRSGSLAPWRRLADAVGDDEACSAAVNDLLANRVHTVSNGTLRHRTASRPEPAAPRPCIGCGGAVPDIAGPRHPYMRSSPGCWATYGEVRARVFGPEGRASDGRHMDCYAVQHPAAPNTTADSEAQSLFTSRRCASIASSPSPPTR
jgi:hypothetical protein